MWVILTSWVIVGCGLIFAFIVLVSFLWTLLLFTVMHATDTNGFHLKLLNIGAVLFLGEIAAGKMVPSNSTILQLRLREQSNLPKLTYL